MDLQDDAAQALVQDICDAGHPTPLYLHCDVRDIGALQQAIAVTGERLDP